MVLDFNGLSHDDLQHCVNMNVDTLKRKFKRGTATLEEFEELQCLLQRKLVQDELRRELLNLVFNNGYRIARIGNVAFDVTQIDEIATLERFLDRNLKTISDIEFS